MPSYFGANYYANEAVRHHKISAKAEGEMAAYKTKTPSTGRGF